ncbi:hypothetical protein GMA8713_05023 [Grimontia marina]|uniref:Uncharacterized protein n=1 Tax=Grimontia marina TaxID=646534 RepID=A0A128FJL6_9GAMM|nr:hypothetical protein GMA8713_05023 [Grimontia marina]
MEMARKIPLFNLLSSFTESYYFFNILIMLVSSYELIQVLPSSFTVTGFPETIAAIAVLYITFPCPSVIFQEINDPLLQPLLLGLASQTRK